MLTPDEVVDNFDFLETWDARYAYLVELGEALPPLDEVYRIEDNRVRGCMIDTLKEGFRDAESTRKGGRRGHPHRVLAPPWVE